MDVIKAIFISSIRLLITCVAILFLISCKKEEEFPSYLNMEMDGEILECDHGIEANGDWDIPSQYLIINGQWEIGPKDIGLISIVLENYDNTPGIKEFKGVSRITLNHNSYKNGFIEFISEYSAYGKNANLNILEVNKKYIKGTFECTATNDLSINHKKIITNGEFHIKRFYP